MPQTAECQATGMRSTDQTAAAGSPRGTAGERRMTRAPRRIPASCVLVLCVSATCLIVPRLNAVEQHSTLARLSLEVQRAEDLRAVKRLQISYAHYLQFGYWDQAASLFTRDGEAHFGSNHAAGASGVGAYFKRERGHGRDGLPAGGVHTLLEDTPVLNLDPDGRTAKGRWHEFWLVGEFGGSARWEQSICENQYAKDGGVWKIARLDCYRETAGAYETGWVTGGAAVELVPFHYTSAEAGNPIPPPPAGLPIPAIKGSPAAALAALDRRIQAMNDEDSIANLANAYGYYTDRKMWNDATDLFAEDGVLELADVGVYEGPRSIRRSFERLGPEGLERGQLNDRLIFNQLITVAASGREARSRSVTLNLLGDFKTGTASLGLDVVENRYGKAADGVWRIREMRIFPIMATDYYQGWARSRLTPAPVSGTFAPDRPVPAADRGTLADGIVPAFLERNPATGKLVPALLGKAFAGAEALTPTNRAGAVAEVAAPPRAPADRNRAITDAARRLSRSVAYIAVDNISHALGNFIDDQQWHSLGQLFAKDGWRAKAAVAFCVGPAHAEECERNYDGVAALPRTSASGHWLIQPVIDVAPDASSATMRHRLLHIDAAPESRGFSDGMYPNNAATLEDGVWKFEVAAPDQPYFSSPSFALGWARPASSPVRRAANRNAVEPLRNFPPDVPRTSMPLRHHGSLPGDTIAWPDLKPMWFSYRNPVSGRVPPFYCPDLKTCEQQLRNAKPAQ
jgi:hypothetical protein